MSQTTPQPTAGRADEQSKPGKNRYKDTLNLPKTSFPMRANLVQNEPASRKRWDKLKLYKEVRASRQATDRSSNRGAWSFHDGPPYANGSIHLGHLLNKVLKDFVVRTKTMAGFDVDYVPGWDCHGLPIEHKVMTELVESGKIEKINSLTEDQRRMAVRRECQKYAEKFVKLQADQMQRLLTLANYDKPYLTMAPEYEAATLEVFADMVGQGLVYRDLKPVHWSIENQTALADAELEYYDREDISVYVMFDAVDPASLAKAFGVPGTALGDGAAFMIWTTTPWTLPANLAIALHPRFTYALVELNGRAVVLAEDLVEPVAKAAGVDPGRVLGTCAGEALAGVRYRHPFADRESAVVLAEYVTLEDGTGLVHTAPGHGAEDYQTGLANGLDIYCPVRGDGTYDDSVPEWLRGMSIWDANPKIVDRLRESGHLFYHHTFTHSYPHDWRGKTPVIFRATEQWFVGVDKATHRDRKSLRDLALAQAGEVAFYPEWGRNRMRGMLESRPDWCLSRQRSWGLPIPAFETPDGEIVLSEDLVRAVAKKVREKGSDIWFTGSSEEILEYWNPKSDPIVDDDTDKAALVKRHDIVDVWFESGSSWNAVMRERDLGYPVDLYLEGSDQHRGWFQSSLLCGLGSTGESPFRALLTHGFMVDKDGRKMSKSIGNTLEVDDLLKDFGADVCRWWVASLNYENDIKVDRSFFEVAGESYRKVRNTLRFLLSNLSDFEAPASGRRATASVTVEPTSLEAWALDAYNDTAKRVLEAYDDYDFRVAHNALYDFCNETLSAVYCAAVKDRLYCDKADGRRRRRTQAAMYDLVDGLARLLAPIMPHTADETFRALRGAEPKDTSVCVHLETYLDMIPVSVDPSWTTVMEVRDDAMRELESTRQAREIDNPLDLGVTVRTGGDTLVDLKRIDPADFADLCGVSRASFERRGDGTDAKTVEFDITDLRDEPRCERSWKRDGTVKQRTDGALLSDRDARAVGVV
ncbi:MAG: isoleucine--tRNA ligase [Phycisphaerales bacterium]